MPYLHLVAQFFAPGVNIIGPLKPVIIVLIIPIWLQGGSAVRDIVTKQMPLEKPGLFVTVPLVKIIKNIILLPLLLVVFILTYIELFFAVIFIYVLTLINQDEKDMWSINKIIVTKLREVL